MPLQPEYVVTFIAGNNQHIHASKVSKYSSILDQAGAKISKKSWLAPEKALDLFCSGLSVEKLYAILNPYLLADEIDAIVQPSETRRKKLLLADMESTIIEQEMLDELAAMIGQREEVVAITHRAMNGELDFASALKERVALLAGQPDSILETAANHITYTDGAEALVKSMRKAGAACWLVSGGFTCFADRIMKLLKFDRTYGNKLLMSDGKIDGSISEPILDKESKKKLLLQGCAELGLTIEDCIAVGDGANDIPMLTTCNAGGGIGIAYHAKPIVRAATPHQINHADLTALLYAQGLELC